MLKKLHKYSLEYLSNNKITYKRYLWNKIDTTEKLIGIVGARGIGKTTYMLQYLKSLDLPLRKKLYISADTPEVIEYSLLKIAMEFSASGGEVLTIDEIHKYKNFEQDLKQMYDMLNLKIIFSGSSAIKLEHSKADLSRRALLYRVNGLSYREFLEIKLNVKLPTFKLEDILNYHEDIVFELMQKFKPLEHFQDYLESGFYPFYFENPNTFSIRLHETVNAVIESDIPSIFPIKYESVINLKKLVKLICNSEPFKINIKELSTKLQTDRDTLYQYLHYLDQARILNILRSKTKGDNIFLKPDKLYLNNPNLNYSYCEEAKIGTIRETIFANQLQEMHKVEVPKKGDFLVDESYLFEVGGKSKDFKQIKDLPNSFIVSDNIQSGFQNRLPLWLFGFLY